MSIRGTRAYRAARLQDADLERARQPTLAEMEAVAAELDIDPQYVDAAIRQLRTEREEVEAARIQRQQVLRTWLIRAGILVGVAGVLVFGLTGALATSGASQLASRSAEVSAAEGRLMAALDRQAALVPSLVGLAGGEVDELTAARRAMVEADTTAERLAASRRLDEALAVALAGLPDASDPSSAQQRLNLQHEISGAQNRMGADTPRVS